VVDPFPFLNNSKNNPMKLLKTLLIVSVAFLAIYPMDVGAQTTSLVKTLPSGQTLFSDTVGYKFTVGSKPLKVSALGVAKGNGLNSANQVGLWNEAGQLLASRTIPLNATLENGYLWQNLSSEITLEPSTTYTIGICGSNSVSEYRYNGALELSSDVTLLGFARNNQSWVFSRPSTIGITGQGAVGANMKYSVDNPDASLRNFLSWGANSPEGRLSVPSDLLNVKSIDAGFNHSVALKSDGTLAAWGGNGGNEKIATVPTGLANIAEIDCGWAWTLVRRENGSLFAWGANDSAQISSLPSGNNFIQISAGNMHGAALRSDGTVVCWGRNDMGQCNVPSGLSGVTAVIAYGHHTMALCSDGSVKSWGVLNNYSSAAAPSGLSGVTSIAAGDFFCLALKSDGTVVAWGDNTYGQTTVPSGLNNVSKIFATADAAFAVKKDGTIVSWGNNQSGQRNIPSSANGGSILEIRGNANHVFATIASLVDTDGDGVSDYREGKDGTDPNNASSLDSLSKGLVAYYPFNGNLIDDSGRGNDLQSGVGISYESDRKIFVNSSLRFAGANSFATSKLPIGISGNQPRSISFWVKLDGASYYNNSIVSFGDGSQDTKPNSLFFSTANGNGFQMWGSYLDKSTQPLVFNRQSWNQVTFVHATSVSEDKFYINGAEVPSIFGNYGRGDAWNTTDTPLTIGKFGEFFQSSSLAIDDVRIYNRALSEAEVSQLYAKEAENPNMVTVQGGTLPQSSSLAGQTVGTFQIGKYEVTWGEWKSVRDWAVVNGYIDLANVGAGSGEDHPVHSVSWYDVVKWSNAKSEMEGLTPAYQVGGATYKSGEVAPTVNASANGYRLPREKEWEWAARGGILSQGFAFSGSNDANVVMWYFGNYLGGTQSVGKKASNEIGIYDMSGNVWEWCEDMVYGSDRRLRGGSIDGWSGYGAVDNRDIYQPPSKKTGSHVGFRLARNASAPADTTAPVVTLNGANPQEVYKGASYTDPGAVVTDNVDAPRTIQGSGTVSTSVVGTYTVTYAASDLAGNLAQPITRNVNVVLNPSGDEDGDGLTNAEEVTLGTNPNLSDTDGDGVRDYREQKDGTNPKSPSDSNPLSKGLVAYYPFNGNAQDESGFGNHGVVKGAVLATDRFGKQSKSYEFDGNTSSIEIADSNSLRPPKQITVSAWGSLDKLQRYSRIITKGVNIPDSYGSYQLITGSNLKDHFHDEPLFAIQTTGGYRVPNPANGQPIQKWIHICGTYDGQKTKLFYNGQLVAEVQSGGDLKYEANPLVIGRDLFYKQSYDGKIDDVRIYNRALSSAEVVGLYEAESVTNAPVITSATDAYGKVGEVFSYQIAASNGPKSYGATNLPPGLQLNPITGSITGIPTTVGITAVTISASNAGGAATAIIKIQVGKAGPVISSAKTATGTVGSAFNYVIQASNGPTSYGATGLPEGLQLNSKTGVISGKPRAAGTWSVAISAINSGGIGKANITIRVLSAIPTITGDRFITGRVGATLSYQIKASNGPTSYGATGLPKGLKINTKTGLISGKPMATGVSNITITATNTGGTGKANLSIRILARK
jgi:formylglycine-generating enzyme required for sulfatase activity